VAPSILARDRNYGCDLLLVSQRGSNLVLSGWRNFDVSFLAVWACVSKNHKEGLPIAVHWTAILFALRLIKTSRPGNGQQVWFVSIL
jgi:hypothetical protein